MITFEQAVLFARAYLGRDPQFADLVVGDYGAEDQATWAPTVGLPAAVLDGDPDAILMDAPILLVDKTTGTVTETTFFNDPERFTAMTPVGVPPAERVSTLTADEQRALVENVIETGHL